MDLLSRRGGLLDFLARHILHNGDDLILREDLSTRIDILVEGSLILDDLGNENPNVPQVGEDIRRLAPRDDLVRRYHQGGVVPARRNARQGDLIPEPSVNDGVRHTELLDVVVHLFFSGGSLSFITLPTGATVMNPQGMNRFTPASLAASTRRSCSS